MERDPEAQAAGSEEESHEMECEGLDSTRSQVHLGFGHGLQEDDAHNDEGEGADQQRDEQRDDPSDSQWDEDDSGSDWW